MKKANKKPLLVGAKSGVQSASIMQNHLTRKLRRYKHRRFLRSKLPPAAEYYARQFPSLAPNGTRQWISVHCCFHEDQHPSLRINLVSGCFRCFGCDASGGDVLAFHQLRYRLSFIQAVTFFNAWE